MDNFRAWVRSILGYKSPIYVAMATLTVWYFAILRGGLGGVRLLQMQHQHGIGRWLKVRGLTYPIFIRPGTADIESIVDNVFREEYGRFSREFSPETIIDAGAYIGDSSAYFLSRFQRARLVALEPNPESFGLAKKNLHSYGKRAVLLKKALWKEEGIVRFGGEETGASIADRGISVEATTVPTLMAAIGVRRISLLKMDIEGAEVQVLESGVGNWLGYVDFLLLETHGKEIEAALIPLLKREGFDVSRHRNVWYCIAKGVD